MPRSAETVAEDFSYFLEHDRIAALVKSLKETAYRMTDVDARFLVDAYYQVQEARKAADNQFRSLTGGPVQLIEWLCGNLASLEAKIKTLLKWYADGRVPGVWAQSIVGIGPVIAAGLSAHIDIARAQTVGHIWRFAGLDPTRQWKSTEAVTKELSALGIKGTLDDETFARACSAFGCDVGATQAFLDHAPKGPKTRTASNVAKAFSRRPWNADLKVLCWKIGQSFVKVCNHEEDIYGHLYQQRKAYEVAKNEAGDYADQAAATLEKVPAHAQRAIYKTGQLPPGRIDQRAQRWATKLFLAHWHHVAYETQYGTPPPKPYVIEHMGHVNLMGPPNWPFPEDKADFPYGTRARRLPE